MKSGVRYRYDTYSQQWCVSWVKSNMRTVEVRTTRCYETMSIPVVSNGTRYQVPVTGTWYLVDTCWYMVPGCDYSIHIKCTVLRCYVIDMGGWAAPPRQNISQNTPTTINMYRVYTGIIPCTVHCICHSVRACNCLYMGAFPIIRHA